MVRFFIIGLWIYASWETRRVRAPRKGGEREKRVRCWWAHRQEGLVDTFCFGRETDDV